MGPAVPASCCTPPRRSPFEVLRARCGTSAAALPGWFHLVRLYGRGSGPILSHLGNRHGSDGFDQVSLAIPLVSLQAIVASSAVMGLNQ
jgi:hypothetical protein